MSILKSFLKFTGDIHISKYPLFVQYKPQFHKLKGDGVRAVIDNLMVGDILLRRHEGYLNVIMTPGFWAHSAIYAGDDKVLHMLGDGIIIEDILDFCRTDNICILRCINQDSIDNAILNIEKFSQMDIHYDFEFESNDDEFYCTELINKIYNGVFDQQFSNNYGKLTLLPDDLLLSDYFVKVIDIEC